MSAPLLGFPGSPIADEDMLSGDDGNRDEKGTHIVAAHTAEVADVLTASLTPDEKSMIDALPFDRIKIEDCNQYADVNISSSSKSEFASSICKRPGKKYVMMRIGDVLDNGESKPLWAFLSQRRTSKILPTVVFITKCPERGFKKIVSKGLEIQRTWMMYPEFAFATGRTLSTLIKHYFFKAGYTVPYELKFNKKPLYSHGLLRAAESYRRSIPRERSIKLEAPDPEFIVDLTGEPELPEDLAMDVDITASNASIPPDDLSSQSQEPRSASESAPSTAPTLSGFEVLENFNSTWDSLGKQEAEKKADKYANKNALAEDEEEEQMLLDKLDQLRSEIDRRRKRDESIAAEIDDIKQQKDVLLATMPLPMQKFFKNAYNHQRNTDQEQ
ncbi:hypothetical protein DM02DRAFT_612492 [Periconia macrospinosa]|uniref:Uncharacterized protein n=1 Tax=Periconia macrospinosa TaxID=97972 RepID=A0A2V1DXQ1_9PLEO|nr:hypothetical protein DM02DRAFT_612492 [Periconia macrospinosa]